MRNELARPRSDAIAGTSKRNLEGEVPSVGVDGQDFILNRFRLVGDLLLELGIAHDLGIVLELV